MFYSQTTGGFYISSNLPADAVEISKDYHAELLAAQAAGKIIISDGNGYPILQDRSPPTTEQIISIYVNAIQKRLDDFSKTRGYDGILSACTYATSTVPKFAGEGQYCVNARDSTWSASYVILADVEAGNRSMPTIDEIMSELPDLAWPV